MLNATPVRALRLLIHLLLRGYLRLYHDYRVWGEKNLHGLKGHLTVANHASHLDALALCSAFPLGRVNAVRSLCARDHFSCCVWKRTLASLLANAVPMRRDLLDRRAVAYCLRRLAKGDNVILFPEGTRSPDGRLRAFLGGVGLLAVKHDLPVLPAYIGGTYRCCAKGARVPRPGRIDVLFGRPARYGALVDCKESWLAVAQDLERRVRELRSRLDEMMAYENASDHSTETARSYAGST